MKNKLIVMIQGTRAGIGKSIVTIGISRRFTELGYKTAVFKAQAMEDKKYTVPEGGFIPPSMACAIQGTNQTPGIKNVPVYLEPVNPEGVAVDNFAIDQKYYLYVKGEFIEELYLSDYLKNCEKYAAVVYESLDSLIAESEVVVIEGGGCPTELGPLGDGFANRKITERYNPRILVISDLITGGAFAAAIGTLNLLDDEYRKKVKGVIFNKALTNSDVEFLKPNLKAFREITNIEHALVLPIMQDMSKVKAVLKFDEVTEDQRNLWGEVYDYWTAHMNQYITDELLLSLLEQK